MSKGGDDMRRSTSAAIFALAGGAPTQIKKKGERLGVGTFRRSPFSRDIKNG